MRARTTAAVVAVVLLGYLGLVAWRGVLLLRQGSGAAALLGTAVLVLPALAAGLLWREWRFGLATQQLGRQLGEEGGLPTDTRPRRAGRRAGRTAADKAFAARRAEAEAAPEDWRAWFRLALAYDDAGDRRRAREAMRRAISLHRAPGESPPAR